WRRLGLRSPRYRSSPDSPLEGKGFEISVPRCPATANSAGAFISAGGWRLLKRRNCSIGLPRATTPRGIPRRRLSVGPQPDRSLGTAAYLARNSTESSERRFRKNSPVVSSEGGWGSQPEMAGEARGKRYARRFRAEGSPFRILESPILHRNAAPS